MDMVRALRVLVDKLNKRKPAVGASHHTAFVKEGAVVPPKRKNEVTGILSKANDWAVMSDTNRRDVTGAIVEQQYPDFMVTAGRERPDIIVYSRSTKTVVLIENTCPDEQTVQKANLRKIKRYSEPRNMNGTVHASLVTKLEAAGWAAHLFCVEVCARGHVAFSVRRCMKALGMPNKEYSTLQRTLEETAIYSLTVIWNSRNNLTWCPARLAVWPVEEMPPLERVTHMVRPHPVESLPTMERSQRHAAIPPPSAAAAEANPADDLPPGIVPRQKPAAIAKDEPGDQNADFEAEFADELELDLSF